MALKHTGLWLTIEGWVDVADIDNDKVFDTKPSHSHQPHPTTKPPPFHPSSLSNSNPIVFCPFHNTVCHVTPCVFLSSESWLKQCASKECSLCMWNEWIHRKSVCLRENRPQWFHKSALKVHVIHCDSSTALAPVCLL